jgi:hypothetical protein
MSKREKLREKLRDKLEEVALRFAASQAKQDLVDFAVLSRELLDYHEQTTASAAPLDPLARELPEVA